MVRTAIRYLAECALHEFQRLLCPAELAASLALDVARVNLPIGNTTHNVFEHPPMHVPEDEHHVALADSKAILHGGEIHVHTLEARSGTAKPCAPDGRVLHRLQQVRHA